MDVDIGSPVNGRRETSSVEAAGSGGDEDVACSVAVLDEDGACSVAVLFLSKPAAVSNALATAMEEQRMLCSNLQCSTGEVCSMLEPIQQQMSVAKECTRQKDSFTNDVSRTNSKRNSPYV